MESSAARLVNASRAVAAMAKDTLSWALKVHVMKWEAHYMQQETAVKYAEIPHLPLWAHAILAPTRSQT